MKDVLAALRTGDGTSAAIFLATVVVTVTVFWWLNRDPPLPARAQREQEPPRNFTLEQLKVGRSSSVSQNACLVCLSVGLRFMYMIDRPIGRLVMTGLTKQAHARPPK